MIGQVIWILDAKKSWSADSPAMFWHSYPLAATPTPLTMHFRNTIAEGGAEKNRPPSYHRWLAQFRRHINRPSSFVLRFCTAN